MTPQDRVELASAGANLYLTTNEIRRIEKRLARAAVNARLAGYGKDADHLLDKFATLRADLAQLSIKFSMEARI